MSSIYFFLSFTVVWLLALASPGPDFFLVLNQGVTNGIRHAFAAAAGVVVGIEVWIIATLCGLKAIVNIFTPIRLVLSIIGGGYLIYLGYQYIKKYRMHTQQTPAKIPASQTMYQSFLSGFMTNVTNPKSLIFFTTLLIQFIPANSSLTQNLIIWVIMTGVACCWFGALAYISSLQFLRNRLQNRIYHINLATGTIFILLGTFMLYESFSPYV